LAAEQAILELTEQVRTAGIAVAAADIVTRAAADAGLGVDQAAVVARLCQGGERVAVMVGPAGAGKSRSLAAARAAWQAAGVAVRGVAPSAVAAGVLAEQAGISADTLAKFLLDAEAGRTRLLPGEVVVCDEASMVSTRDLARLVTLTHAAGGKAVLVGDHRQLGSVDAGGLFRLLAADAHTAELTAIRRFSEPWEADATRRLRAADTSVLCEYETRGRISSGDRTAMLDAAHAAWAAARADGRTVVVMASDHDTVNQLALRARTARVAAGEVAAAGIHSGGQIVGVGDELVTTLNDRRLVTTAGGWVRNGDRWRVQSHRSDGTVVLDSLDGRGRVTAPADYASEHLSLAYAVTVHKSQGLTVDDAVLVVDTNTAAEHLYVGMTRGRHTNHAYVTCEPADTDHGGRRAPSAHDVLAGALRRTANERSATETDRDRPDSTIADIRTLQATLEEARRRIDAAAGPDRRGEIGQHRRTAAEHADAARALADAETRLARLTAARHAAGEALERADAARRQAQQPRFLLPPRPPAALPRRRRRQRRPPPGPRRRPSREPGRPSPRRRSPPSRPRREGPPGPPRGRDSPGSPPSLAPSPPRSYRPPRRARQEDPARQNRGQLPYQRSWWPPSRAPVAFSAWEQRQSPSTSRLQGGPRTRRQRPVAQRRAQRARAGTLSGQRER